MNGILFIVHRLQRDTHREEITLEEMKTVDIFTNALFFSIHLGQAQEKEMFSPKLVKT